MSTLKGFADTVPISCTVHPDLLAQFCNIFNGRRGTAVYDTYMYKCPPPEATVWTESPLCFSRFSPGFNRAPPPPPPRLTLLLY